MNTLYNLSYAVRGQKKTPTLTVTVTQNQYQKLINLWKNGAASLRDLSQYLKKDVDFDFETFGFGYGGCVVIEKTNTTVSFVFSIEKMLVRNSVATLENILNVIELSSDGGDLFDMITRNSEQIFTVDTGFGIGGLHSHAISGWVSPFFKTWLTDYYNSHKRVRTSRSSSEVCLIPQHITEAMFRTWKATSGRNPTKSPMDNVGGLIYAEGRFVLMCPGDACDVAIYPDNIHRISSHNLDMPEQQLTLLAGVFALFETVIKYSDAKSAP